MRLTLRPEMDEIYKFAERNLHEVGVRVLAEHGWFYNISRSAAV